MLITSGGRLERERVQFRDPLVLKKRCFVDVGAEMAPFWRDRNGHLLHYGGGFDWSFRPVMYSMVSWTSSLFVFCMVAS